MLWRELRYLRPGFPNPTIRKDVVARLSESTWGSGILFCLPNNDSRILEMELSLGFNLFLDLFDQTDDAAVNADQAKQTDYTQRTPP